MNKIKELRSQSKVSQGELATHLEVTIATVSRYETGDREPDQNTLIKIADFFNVSVDYLLGKTDNPTTSKEISDNDIKFALFGGDVTDEKFEVVKRFAQFIRDNKNHENNK